MSEWHPIKTAPKDGTEFLAWVPNGYVILLYAFDVEAFVEQETGDKIETATHWMLLPEPPDRSGK